MTKKSLVLSVLLGLILSLVYLGACEQRDKTTNLSTNESDQELLVYAAASLGDVLSDIVAKYESQEKVQVRVNLGSSGTLARQMIQGEIPDLYLSASKTWVDYVDSLGYLLPGYKADVARNDLVLIAPIDLEIEAVEINKSLNLASLLGEQRLSMGDPRHVPAGRYAQQSLEYYDWSEQIKGKVLPAKDVRSALMLVELGETPLGIVYGTDAQKSDKVKILNAFPRESHEAIVYVAAVCKENKLAKDFFSFLGSQQAHEIWEKHGFEH